MRRVTLFAVMSAVALALGAAPANAEDPVFPGDPYESVEVFNAATEDLCGEVTVDGPDVSGGCVNGSMHTSEFHVGGVTCTATLGQINVDGDGSFSATDIVVGSPNPSLPTCFLSACLDGNDEQLPWSGTYFTHGSLELAYVPVCVQHISGGTYTDAMSVVVDHDPGSTEAWAFSASFDWLSTGDWNGSVGTEIDWFPGA